MEINFARKLVKDALQHSFEKERFTYLVKNLLNKIEETPQTVYRGNYIPDAYKEYITTLERIGKYEDPDGKKLDILVISLAKTTSLERARTMQRNFVAWYLNGSRGGILKDAALAAFVAPDEDDWRFSFIKMEYKLVETAKGVKAEEEFTPARRYSFLVGKNETTHTAQSRLVPILCEDERDPTLKELEDIFGIEKVTREFFENYRDLFLRLNESLEEIVKKNDKIKTDFEAKSVDTINFAKKLLGQIVFLYFLQKKGWFGVKRGQEWGSGSKHFLRELFEKRHSDYKNFFNDILEPLFYEALRQDRSYDKDYYSRFDCRIPFLNGGLFDPINDYDWVDTNILLPNELFSNSENTKEGDTGTGILDVFDRYNFTVKEDEPLEKEVAIDPEMLGKVFENLLEVKDRKSKGTYYTPREIVHYMCQQSLINYLASTVYIEKKPIASEKPVQKKFFGGSEHQQLSLRSNEPAVSQEDITSLILHGQSVLEHDKTVEAKGKETRTYSYRMPSFIRENAAVLDKALESIRVCDPAVGSGAFLVGMMHEIVNTRQVLSTYLNGSKNRTPYEFKRHAIQTCLYGVDIDPSAVEIAKLRLWLSLIVDEDDIKQIKPLPNLDYKIVCGNSLLGIEKNILNWSVFNQLERVKQLYFDETNIKQKQKYRSEIEVLIKQASNDGETFDFKIYFSEVFHNRGGFDVVIANPPYISYYSKQSKKLEKDIERYLRNNYEFLKGYSKKLRINSIMFFLEKGYDLIGKDGVMSYIMDLNVHENPFKPIRKFLSNRMNLYEIISGLTAFENVGSGQVVLISGKGIREENHVVTKNNLQGIPQIIKQSDLVEDEDCSWSPKANQGLIKKIEKETTQLSQLLEIHTGVAVNATKEGKKFFLKDQDGDNCFPILSGGKSIRCSYCKPIVSNYLLYDKQKEKELNVIFDCKYFKEHGSHQRPFNLRRLEEYDRPKLILRQSDIKLTSTFSDDLVFGNYSLFNAYTPDNDIQLLKFLLALINSKLLTYYALKKEIILVKPGKTPQVRSGQRGPIGIRQLPIKLKKADKPLFLSFVDKILNITKSEDYLENSTKQAKVKELEAQIDQMVYALYGLTDAEIAIIKNR